MKDLRMLDILGFVLTPVLLVSLVIIIVKGFLTISPSSVDEVTLGSGVAFSQGFSMGYIMMDLMAAFFFSKTILNYFEAENGIDLGCAVKAGGIGMGILAIIYVAFAFLGSYFSSTLHQVPSEQILMYIATEILGSTGGAIATIAISFACITTAMALADVSAQFLAQDLCKGKIKAPIAMVIVLIISILISSLEFTGIANLLGPILEVCYPFLIVLTLVNLTVSLIKRSRENKAKLALEAVA